PAAGKTRRLALAPVNVGYQLIFGSATPKTTGVARLELPSPKATEFRAKVIFLCASTLESVRLLFNSSTTEFPNGLGNSSGELGHNLMDHVKTGGADATLPGMEDRHIIGRRPNGIYVPRFRNVKTRHPDFLRGYGFQGQGFREGWSRGIGQVGFGPEFKKSLSQPGPWQFSIYGYGEFLPNHNNLVE